MLVLPTTHLRTSPAVKQSGGASQKLGAKHLVWNSYFQRRSCPTKKARPIKIPLLSHNDFRNATKQWLTSKIIPVKDFLIPFHLPPCHVVSAARSSMGTILTNHHAMMAQFSWDTPPPCNCSLFRQKHPNIGGVDHPDDGQWRVASPLDALNVSKRLRFFLGTSSKTQVYPALSSYIDETWAEVQRWAQRHFVPNVTYQDWETFIRSQWSQHTISSRTPLSFDDIKYIKSVVAGYVVQGRDPLEAPRGPQRPAKQTHSLPTGSPCAA